jgi:hypothetical protein
VCLRAGVPPQSRDDVDGPSGDGDVVVALQTIGYLWRNFLGAGRGEKCLDDDALVRGLGGVDIRFTFIASP